MSVKSPVIECLAISQALTILPLCSSHKAHCAQQGPASGPCYLVFPLPKTLSQMFTQSSSSCPWLPGVKIFPSLSFCILYSASPSFISLILPDITLNFYQFIFIYLSIPYTMSFVRSGTLYALLISAFTVPKMCWDIGRNQKVFEKWKKIESYEVL